VSPETVHAFFEQIQPNLEGVPLSHIFNYDETGFRDDPGAEVAFFGRNLRYHEKIQNHSKAQVSVEFCCSADSTMLPPMTVYKSASGNIYQSWCEGVPDTNFFGATKSGWFDKPQFETWFKKVFLPYIQKFPKEEPKVLIGDNLAAHLSPVVTELCQKHNVRFIFLPENSTHLLQPLDLAVFSPVKKEWRAVITDWKEEMAAEGKNFASIPKQVIIQKKLFISY
jgi:hypothetical protein